MFIFQSHPAKELKKNETPWYKSRNLSRSLLRREEDRTRRRKDGSNWISGSTRKPWSAVSTAGGRETFQPFTVGGRSKASRNEALCMPRRHYCKPQVDNASVPRISRVQPAYGPPPAIVESEGRSALHATSFSSRSTWCLIRRHRVRLRMSVPLNDTLARGVARSSPTILRRGLRLSTKIPGTGRNSVQWTNCFEFGVDLPFQMRCARDLCRLRYG